MGGGFMDDVPYYAYKPSMGVRRYPTGSPLGSRNVVRSPYFPEPEATDIAEPYYNGGLNGYHRMPSVPQRYGRGHNPPVQTAKVPVRKIVVTDGKDARKEATKEVPRVKEEVKKSPKKCFDSADDAARYVQSRYRGYLVQKTQSLKHLRIIKEVGEKLKEFQMQACDPEYLMKLREINMERLKFNEMIMHQLLKLDSLQGVHPLVRDMRKAVTRELIRLQDVTEAAIASGRTPTADDLKFVETPVNSADEDDAAQSCETEDEMAVQESDVGEDSLPVQESKVEEDSIPVLVSNVEVDSIPVQVSNVEKESIPVQESNVEEDSIPVQVSNVEEESMPVEESNAEEDSSPVHVSNMEEDRIPVQQSNVEEDSLPLTTEDEEAAAAGVRRMEIDDGKEGVTEETTLDIHRPADMVEEQPMEEVNTPVLSHEGSDARANDGAEYETGALSHDENEEGWTAHRVQAASGHEFLGTDADAEMELPGVHNSRADSVSTSAEGDEVLVDVETRNACALSTNPSSGDVDTEGRKTARGDCDRKRKLEDSDVGEGSTIDLLRQLKKENELLKRMFEQMMHQQTTSMCNLSERLDRLEDHVRRSKKKPASGRKVNSIRKSRTQMDED